MKSKRKDGLGHWPRGKRRNEDRGDWSGLRLRLRRLIDDHWQQGVVSIRAAAEAVGVSDRSIRRYLSGEDRPAPETQEAIAGWIDERRTAIRRASK